LKSRLEGCLILIAEDELLVALDLELSLKAEGATPLHAATLGGSLIAVEDIMLSAAIVDFVLDDGDSSLLCHRLVERHIPFITYSGVDEVPGPCAGSKQLKKPQSPAVMVDALVDLISDH
jgi:DNA-binding response OmpR family regulator